jgi:hypothetical protein
MLPLDMGFIARFRLLPQIVIAGLDPAIQTKAWITGSSPAMTSKGEHRHAFPLDMGFIARFRASLDAGLVAPAQPRSILQNYLAGITQPIRQRSQSFHRNKCKKHMVEFKILSAGGAARG